MPSDTSSQSPDCWRIRVTGRVQGVSFRAYAKREAEKMGLAGSVANLRDGSVEIIAEGSVSSLTTFRHWCETGPPHANVAGVEVISAQVIGRQGFTVRRSVE